MIRLYYEGNTELFYNRPTIFMLGLSKWLGTHQDIHLVPFGKDIDAIWTTVNRLSNRMLDWGVPIILEDKHQGPEIFREPRELLAHPQVKMLLKQTQPIFYEEHNAHLVAYSLHQTIIANCFECSAPGGKYWPPLTSDNVSKIAISWNYITWSDFINQTRYEAQDHPKLCARYLVDPYAHKPIDVNYIANISTFYPPVPIVTMHRQAGLDQANDLPMHNKVVRRGDCTPDTRMPWEEYFSILCRSKITISPWGWEPLTIRDIEACLAGSVVIKPDTSSFCTWPEIEYVACRPDFKDLSEKVDQILSDWDRYTTMRENNIKTLSQAAETVGNRVAEIIRKCVSQSESHANVI